MICLTFWKYFDESDLVEQTKDYVFLEKWESIDRSKGEWNS